MRGNEIHLKLEVLFHFVILGTLAIVDFPVLYISKIALVETAVSMKLKKFSELWIVNDVQLHCIFHYCNYY